MDEPLRRLAAKQADLVAAWQLRRLGWSWRMIQRRAANHGWRRVHGGVFALTHSRLTRRQRWIAATLTTPESVLSYASAGDLWGFRPFYASFETITRPGSGGPRRQGGLLICRSRTLEGNVVVRDGIQVTTPERTLIDLAAQLPERATGKAFREAIRLKLTSARDLLPIVRRHQGRRGTAQLGRLAARYSSLPYARCRSDAEARALEVLHDEGVELPKVNIRIAGQEADLSWPARRLIVEIDGPQYHLFADEDARKQRVWEGAGYTVRRIESDATFDDPERLLRLACPPSP
jgi:very-short-patch-repair endonuclease